MPMWIAKGLCKENHEYSLLASLLSKADNTCTARQPLEGWVGPSRRLQRCARRRPSWEEGWPLAAQATGRGSAGNVDVPRGPLPGRLRLQKPGGGKEPAGHAEANRLPVAARSRYAGPATRTGVQPIVRAYKSQWYMCAVPAHNV